MITVSGLPGSGTSTLCKLLSEDSYWVHLNVGQAFRELAEETGISLAEFGRVAERDAEVDRQLDARMIQSAQKHKHSVLEGRLTGWMALRNDFYALKIWVDADPEIRADRVSARDGQSPEQAMVAIEKRVNSERKRYREFHDIDLDDLSIYDLVLDSSAYSPEQLVDQVRAVAAHYGGTAA